MSNIQRRFARTRVRLLSAMTTTMGALTAMH